jgi:anaerobic selenocysteine-containing dehydrogenase
MRSSIRNVENVRTLCRMCDHGCGIEVSVVEGKPVKLKGFQDHP